MVRKMGRIVAVCMSPRNPAQILDCRRVVRAMREHLAALHDRPLLLDALLPYLAGHGALVDLLERALVAAPPTERSNGGYIAPGYDAELDELRKISGDRKSKRLNSSH